MKMLEFPAVALSTLGTQVSPAALSEAFFLLDKVKQLLASVHTQFPIHLTYMGLCRVEGNIELISRNFYRTTLTQQYQHFALALQKVEDRLIGCSGYTG